MDGKPHGQPDEPGGQGHSGEGSRPQEQRQREHRDKPGHNAVQGIFIDVVHLRDEGDAAEEKAAPGEVQRLGRSPVLGALPPEP